MTTQMRQLLEEAAGIPDDTVDVDAALRRGDGLRQRRQLAVGALASVVVLAVTGLAMQLPGGVPIPEVADQDESEPSHLQDDSDPQPDLELSREDLRDIADGRLDDGRAWTARAAHTADRLCVLFAIADRDLVDNCWHSTDRRQGIFVSSVADRPGGADVTVGYVGGDWYAPVELEFPDATTIVAELHQIEGEGSGVRFFLAEHGDEAPTHVVVRDEHGEPQRSALRS